MQVERGTDLNEVWNVKQAAAGDGLVAGKKEVGFQDGSQVSGLRNRLDGDAM